MTDEEARHLVVRRLMSRADHALAAAQRDFDAGDFNLVINRVYYACFYAASAVLMQQGMRLSRHSAIRSAVHRHLVKEGKLSVALGQFYDDAFENRQEADYDAVAEFDREGAQSAMVTGGQFVAVMRRLVEGGGSPAED